MIAHQGVDQFQKVPHQDRTVTRVRSLYHRDTIQPARLHLVVLQLPLYREAPVRPVPRIDTRLYVAAVDSRPGDTVLTDVVLVAQALAVVFHV